jgi:aminoglycoside phosphotransferase (APT) family kinase protein
MEREHRVLSRLSKAFAPAPNSFHLCADCTVIGVPFHLLEYREGTVFNGDRLPQEMGASEAGQQLSSEMVSALVRLHEIDAGAVGLGELGKPEGFYERNVAGWLRRAEALNLGADSQARVAQVAAWLLANVPSPSSPTLLHSDFKLDNCMFDADLRITTILDWDMSTRGDPLMDLATLLSYWVQPGDPDCMLRLGQMPTSNHPFPSRSDVIEAYAGASGRDVGGFKSWRVLALLKLGVVFIQLHRNWARGAMAGADYSHFAVLGAEIVDFAAHETLAAI